MNLLKLVGAGINALRKGEILTHPERWKTAQAVSMALAAVAVPVYSALCSSAEVCYGISQDQVTQIATWVGGIAFAVFQIWTTLATSEKVGIAPKKNEEPIDIIRARPIAKLREPERSTPPEQVRPNTSGNGATRNAPASGPFFDQ